MGRSYQLGLFIRGDVDVKDLHQAERFKPSATRRDFLGLAAAWSAVLAFMMAMLGAFRLPMPSVFPESDSKVKLGHPNRFEIGTSTYYPKHQLWLFRDEQGFYAISSICTHLGCVAERKENGKFDCPCHGSKFSVEGEIEGGPAPKGLLWLDLSVSPEGVLVADTLSDVNVGTRLTA